MLPWKRVTVRPHPNGTDSIHYETPRASQCATWRKWGEIWAKWPRNNVPVLGPPNKYFMFCILQGI